MIRITKVEFENYRQYRSVDVSFTSNKRNDLHILRAKNGTGKTTFLNGILWCLYGVEHYLSDKDKALPIVNRALVQKAEPKAAIKVLVRLTLNSDGMIIVFERTQPFFVTVNPMNNVKNAVAGTTSLRVIITPKNDVENSYVVEDEATAQSFVKMFFDEAIYDYYFFDGENLKSYFLKGKSAKIKQSIFNISQVTLLSNASAHVKAMADTKSRQASKLVKESSSDIIDEIARLEAKIAELEEDTRRIEQRIPEVERIISDADATLQGYSPIRLNIERRTNYAKELKGLKSDYESFVAEKNTFIVTYLTLLNFYPRVKAALELIREKQESGTLPPNIDKDQIQALLDDHATTCPVCNGALDERAINHLRKLLEQLDVSSATSNFLMEIKGGLEAVVSRCKSFPSHYATIMKKEKYFLDAIQEKQEALDNISAFLAQYSDESGAIDVKKVEGERKRANEEMISLRQRLVLNQSDIKRHAETLRIKNEEKDRMEEKRGKKDLLSKQVSTLRLLCSRYDGVQRAIMDEIKEEIQRKTWERFSSMIWKKYTFGRIEINDQYELTVYNTDGNQMTGSLSATEYMALAYSFTLAIHDASGKNCPLVVDSPLGRVSDDNRANMANELLKVSANKQIIMLFTPDEYSDEVRELYDSNAASIRDIALSDNEEQIEGVGDTNA